MDLPDYMLIEPPPPPPLPLDKNDPSLVKERQKMEEFRKHYEEELKSGGLTPAPYSYEHYFTGVHSEFGAALYGRALHMSKGTVIVGKIHKHPALNVLLKGKVVAFSEGGRKEIEAPCVFPSAPGARRVGYVLEDCIWLNVLMTKHVGEESLEEVVQAHTTDSYADIGLIGSMDELNKIQTTVA